VESLLSESEKTAGFMDTPAAGLSIGSLRPPSLEGYTLNHYVVGPLVGSGGMAEVYRARDTKLGRTVAIKFLNQLRLVSPESLSVVYREARVLASLNHPNIGAIYGIEESEGLCGLVLEFVEGDSLAERIKKGRLAVADALKIARQVIAGLQAAHAKGIIHRDLKPSNIKVTPDGVVKLVDFGLAKLLGSLPIEASVADISRHGVVMGTVAYMSPEQARGKEIDVRTDVWAFGCLFYEMLTGKAAFRGDTPTDIIVKIAAEEPDWTESPRLEGSNSPEMERLVRRCLHKDPSARFSSVSEIAARLETLDLTSHDTGISGAVGLSPVKHDEFVPPIQPALPLFMFAQFGYLAIYFAAMYYVESVTRILNKDFGMPATETYIATMILAMCGIATRIYLISAVWWRHPEAERKFTQLFPVLLVFDGIWAASPLLLGPRVSYELAFVGVALLAYVPFAQRTLLRAIYGSM
jgi:serine/threonine protein kinase